MTKKYTTLSDLEKLSRVSHRMSVWVEGRLSKTFMALKKLKPQDDPTALLQGKEALLKWLVVLIDVTARLERIKTQPMAAPRPLPVLETREDVPTFSEADVALVRSYLDKME